MASRFVSSIQQEIEKLLEDKDSENTKRSTEVAKELFYEYHKEKNLFMCKREKRMDRLSLFSSKQCIIKHLLDSVFVISGIIKVSVSVISPSLRLITLTSTLIIPDITKTSSNNCLQIRAVNSQSYSIILLLTLFPHSSLLFHEEIHL